MNQQGFEIQLHVFSDKEVAQFVQGIEEVSRHNSHFRANKDLFAIRNLLGEVPALQGILSHRKLQDLLQRHFRGNTYHCIKGIYFDKPPQSNWVVNWHQDLTINVCHKPEDVPDGFTHWIQKKRYWSVQPPLAYLQNIITIRIHLDNCHAQNGALKILEGSHHQITQAKDLDRLKVDFPQTLCEVSKGGVLLMSPLLWHASSKNKSKQNRRIIHLEFSSLPVPPKLQWFEKF